MTTDMGPAAVLGDTRSLRITGGLVSIAVGVILLVWPTATVTILAVLLGVDLIILGVLLLVASFATDTSVGEKVLGSLLGVLAVLAGVAVFGRPLQTVGVIVVVAGAFWVVGGVIEVVTGLFGHATGSRWAAVLSGVVSIAFGVTMLSWPGPTVAVAVWLIGIWCLVSGLIRLFQGFTTPRPAAA
jgi:uncharacterized membrane protein HdeD (DUF308 family)